MAYNERDLSEQFVTQSAFSQARLKVKPSAFVELNEDCINHFYSFYKVKKWNGFRLIAIDGSEIILPKTEETIKEYGEYQTNFMNKTVVLARLSKAYDVLNGISIDAMLVNRKIGEHTLAKMHLKKLERGNLILFDRGYPSYDLFRNTLANGNQFCARVAIANWAIAKKLIETVQKELFAEIRPGHDIKKRYTEEGIEYSPILCRFICVELSSGEKEVLITSLVDTEKYPYEVFKELYHCRWQVEEAYKKDKHRLQLENFSGNSVIAIQQDFHANILLGNITAILSSNLDQQIRRKRKKTKYQYQINITCALAKVKEILVLIFTGLNIVYILEKLMQMFLSNVEPVRPNRRFNRYKDKRKRYHKCFLPL